MTQALREQMGAAAVAAARAVNYVGAGTVEFIVETIVDAAAQGRPKQGTAPSGGSAAHEVASVGAFYFMEMNTRLQVEHPVTEAITGLDLVEWQLRVASGEKLPLAQNALRMNGHAIEARICAENPDKNFLPATGALHVYALPDCVTFERGACRVDSGVRQGDAISPYYDSMIAKLIVHGRTREEALGRLDAALAQTHIVGLQTNVQFLRHVVKSQSFAQADLDTALIPREASALFNQEKVGLPIAAAACIVHTLTVEREASRHRKGSDWADPWDRRDGWKPFGLTTRRFDFEFHNEPATATLTYLHHGALQLALARAGVTVPGGALVFEAAGGRVHLAYAGQRQQLTVYRNGDVCHIFGGYGATQIASIDVLAHAGGAQSEGGRLTAPMPGKVVSFAVKVGDRVVKGQALAVMDAMKMEHTIAAPTDGTVAELLYAPGDQVAEGAELLKLG